MKVHGIRFAWAYWLETVVMVKLKSDSYTNIMCPTICSMVLLCYSWQKHKSGPGLWGPCFQVIIFTSQPVSKMKFLKEIVSLLWEQVSFNQPFRVNWRSLSLYHTQTLIQSKKPIKLNILSGRIFPSPWWNVGLSAALGVRLHSLLGTLQYAERAGGGKSWWFLSSCYHPVSYNNLYFTTEMSALLPSLSVRVRVKCYT